MANKTTWQIFAAAHSDLIITKELAYDPCGFNCTHLVEEPESAEYGACSFRVNGRSVKFRVAKTTPTKTGQFVTIWKRSVGGPIEPFEVTDDIDLVVVSARSQSHFGQFIFPKSVLVDQGIMSADKREGKRGIRVYPPWDIPGNNQAITTQKWQLGYFLDIPPNSPIDIVRSKILYTS